MARLVIQPGLPTARQVELKQGSNFVGRGSNNDVRFEDPSVSGSHCEIVVKGASAVIRDLGSTNGTFVNRQPVREATLVPGQVVHLGALEMLFQADAPAPSPLRVPVTALPSKIGEEFGSIGTVTSAPAARKEEEEGDTTVLRPVGTAKGASNVVQLVPRTESPPVRSPGPPPPPPLTSAQLKSPPPIVAPGAGAPPPPVSPGSQNCKHHPKTQGRFFCNHCQHCFCELCVTSRNVGGVARKFCRHCGTELTALQVRIERPVEAGFFARLPGAFVYPLLGSGILVLIVGMLLLAGMSLTYFGMRYGGARLFAGGLIGQVFVGGYLFAYLQNIVHSTACGDREMPDLPGMSSVLDDIILPFFRLLGVCLASFAPMIAVAIWAISRGDSTSPIAVVSAAVFGCLYFPMAFLAVATLDSVAAANPLVVVPSILKVPLEYLVTVVLLGSVFGAWAVGEVVIPALFGKDPMSTHDMTKLLTYCGVTIFWGFVDLYLLTVTMRILGLLYLTRKEKLGWHNH
jgi:hypothetical protein